MKLSKRIGSFMLALAVIMTLVMVPKFESNASVSTPTFLYQTGATANSISFKWNGVADATGYQVILRAKTSSGPVAFQDIVPANQTSITVTQNIYKGYQYYAQVYAVKGSEYSRTYAGGTLYAMPATPGNIYLYDWSPNSSTPYLRWAGVVDSDYAYTPYGYEVQYYTLAGKKVKKFTCSYNSLYKSVSKIKNQGFKVSIRSYIEYPTGQGGLRARTYSDWSKQKSFVSYPKIKSSKHYIGSSISTVKWKKVKGAKKYVIYKASGSGTTLKLKKWKTVSGSTTSIEVPRSYNKIVIVPQIKVKGKTYKWKKGDYQGIHGTYV